MQIRIRHWVVLLMFVGALLIGGCTAPQAASQSSTTPPAAASTPAPATGASNPQASNQPRLEGKATVVVVVKGSPIGIEVDGTNAPVTAGNFVDLVQQGVYDGLVFHRVVRDPRFSIAQGGDPQSKNPKFPAELLGTGGFIDRATGQQRYIPLEIKPAGSDSPVYSKTFDEARISAKPQLQHSRGAIAMARSQLPDSASSQFYITSVAIPALDGSYAVFGNVTQGMDVVDKIQQGDRIESAKVTKGIENLKK